MKRFIKRAILCTLSFFFFIHCQKTIKSDNAAQAIPKTALSVTVLNMPSLLAKADFETMKQLAFYKALVDSASAENQAVANILKDPKTSGVDLTKPIYIVQNYSWFTGNGGTTTALLLNLSDAKTFENLLKSGKDPLSIETKNGVKYSLHTADTSSDDATFNSRYVAWNDKLAVLGFGQNTVHRAPLDGEESDFLTFFKTQKEESISQDSVFKKLLSQVHDVYSYTSLDGLAESPDMKSGASVLDLSAAALTGNYFTSYVDFEKGAILSKSDYKINPEIRQKYGRMFKETVKTDFSKYLKGRDIGFALTLALDMNGLKEIINANVQWRMLLELGNANSPFSTDDIFKAFDGDMLLAAHPTSKEDWQAVMGFKLQDKTAMEKLVNTLVSENILVADGNGVFSFTDGADLLSNAYTGGYVHKGKIAFVGDVLFAGEAEAINQLKKGEPVSADVKDVLNKNILGLYVHFGQLFAFSEDMHDPEISEMKAAMKTTEGNASLRMRDANQNSFKSLMQALNRWYLKMEAEKQERPENMEDGNRSEL